MISFSKYQASEKDFEAIEDSLRAVWHPKMRFVFRDVSKIAQTVLISYDSKFIYLWSPKQIQGLEKMRCGLKRYFIYRIAHKLKLKDEWQYAWCAGIWDKKIEELLPKEIQQSTRFEIPKISGGLLTPFIELQKRKNLKYNAYTTQESCLATIVHEFGHIYWAQHKLWWYSNKKENLRYLNLALKLYQGERIPKVKVIIPTDSGIDELFTVCVEYEAASLFWPNHKQSLDIFIKHRLKELIKDEKKKDLEREDSVLEPNRNPHNFAFVFGKMILTHYPQTWPQILTSPKILRLMP